MTLVLLSFFLIALRGGNLWCGEQVSGSNGQQQPTSKQPSLGPSPIPPRIATSAPRETATAEKAGQGKQQSQQTWRDYFRKAFDAAYLSSWVLAGLAVGGALIALLTLGAIKEQAKVSRITLSANRIAANAAKKSADAAIAAIESNRPLIELVELKLGGLHRAPNAFPLERQNDPDVRDFLTAYFKIKNAGLSPAIVDQAVAFLGIWPNGQLPPEHHAECRPLYLPEMVIKPDSAQQQFMLYHRGYLADVDFDPLAGLKSRLILYGVIRYHSLAGRKWSKPFVWIWQMAGLVMEDGQKGFFVPGPVERNRETEDAEN